MEERLRNSHSRHSANSPDSKAAAFLLSNTGSLILVPHESGENTVITL